jgi:DNA-binding GntR family transcriptional regulator
LSIARSVHYRTERYVRAHLIVTGAIRQAEREHRMLLKLMTERAATAAVRLVREHILNAKNALLEAMAIENVES